MKKIIAVGILSVTNLLSTLGTLVAAFFVIAISSYDTHRVDSDVDLEIFLIIGVMAVIEIVKWVAFYLTSFRKKNAWLIFHALYLIIVFIIGYFFMDSFVVIIILANILAIYFLYEQNKVDASNTRAQEKKGTVINSESPMVENMIGEMDKSHHLAMVLLLVVSLYIAYDWMHMVIYVFNYPQLLTFISYTGRFIFSTLMMIFIFYGMKKIWTNRQSKWKFIFIAPLSIPMLTWIVNGFFMGTYHLTFIQLVRLNPLFISTYLIALLCYVVALVLLARKDKV